VSSRNQTKPLLGIETYSRLLHTIITLGRNQTKPLLGIETEYTHVYSNSERSGRNQTKPLLGIETHWCYHNNLLVR